MNFFSRIGAIACLFFFGFPLLASGDVPVESKEMFAINNTWMMVSAFLVFIMYLGFAALEAGVRHGKNTVPGIVR